MIDAGHIFFGNNYAEIGIGDTERATLTADADGYYTFLYPVAQLGANGFYVWAHSNGDGAIISEINYSNNVAFQIKGANYTIGYDELSSYSTISFKVKLHSGTNFYYGYDNLEAAGMPANIGYGYGEYQLAEKDSEGYVTLTYTISDLAGKDFMFREWNSNSYVYIKDVVYS